MMAYLGQLNRPLVDELADVVSETLGWDGEQKQREVARLLEILQDRHGVNL
jgi:glycerol-3-phosphate dehydrogenase